MQSNFRNWVLKWHYWGGIVFLPFIVLLAITGAIYLFKEQYEAPKQQLLRTVQPKVIPISLEKQWLVATDIWEKKPTALVLNKNKKEATEFVSGRFSHKSSLFIDPYTANVTGKLNVKETDMYVVRKLHGELLLGTFGTLIIELTASWMVVLILSGLIVYWPKGRGVLGFISLRTKTKKMFFRDLHGLTGFWFSWLLLLILAGGLPWTDVFGSAYKWVQKETKSGFESTWSGRSFASVVKGKRLTLDQMATIAYSLQLKGSVSVLLPTSETSVFSVTNDVVNVSDKRMVHLDQYSGRVIHANTHEAIGGLMKTRLWIMAFHQGQFGLWNWLLVLITAVGLVVMSLAAVVMYVLRKKNEGGTRVALSSTYALNKSWMLVVGLLCVVLPLFGASVVLILIGERLVKNSS